MDPRIIDLYDRYTHSRMGRRAFLAELGRLAGGAAAAATLLPLIENNYAAASTIAADDARLVTGYVDIPREAGALRAYQARPASAPGKLPGVLVIHENRGLNPHIEDVARRVALGGFIALAPDGLSRLGGTPADADRAREMIYTLSAEDSLADFMDALAWLDQAPGSNGKVGCVGFCWGGAMSGRLAVNSPILDAAVVYYGSQPPAADVVKIRAPLLLHYAGLDERINAGIDGFVAALEAGGKRYELHRYEGVNHAFNNDTNAARHDPAAAALAWERTMAFLHQELG